MTQTQKEVAIALTAAAITAGALSVVGRLGANEDGIRVKNGSIDVIAGKFGFEPDGKKFKTKEKVKGCLTLVRVTGSCKAGSADKDVVGGVKSFTLADDNAEPSSYAFEIHGTISKKLELEDGTGWNHDPAKNMLTRPTVGLASVTAYDKDANTLVVCSRTGPDLDIVLVPTDCP